MYNLQHSIGPHLIVQLMNYIFKESRSCDSDFPHTGFRFRGEVSNGLFQRSDMLLFEVRSGRCWQHRVIGK